MKVLYLSVWYPSERDRMAGLFVQNHAQAAAAQGVEVRVNTWWQDADLVQLNVLTLKMGLVAYVLKRVFGIPYILVEHWAGFMPENGQYLRFPRWKRRLLEQIAAEASAIYTVSPLLEKAMKDCGIKNSRWGHVDNIVDDCFYRLPALPPSEGTKRLLHVSCFLERAKNVKGLLRAVKTLSRERQDFTLTLVGNGPDWQACRDYADSLSLPEGMLRWTGEIAPQGVAREMQQSDANILVSRFETYGIPLAEAMAVGIPSVESDATGLRLTKETGLSVPADDEAALTDAIRYMLDHAREYDRSAIRRHGTRFSTQEVGKQLMKIYEQSRIRS